MKVLPTLNVITIIAVFLVGCGSSNPFQPSPKMIVHAITQNHEDLQEDAKKQQDKIKDMLRLPDRTRPLDRTRTLEVLNGVSGIKSTRWLNRSTVLIQPSAYFGNSTLDDGCHALESIGDSRWAILAVEIYDGKKTSLQSKNCQMPKG